MSADLLEAFGGDGEDQAVQPSPAKTTSFNDSPVVTQRRDTGLIHSRRFDPEPPPPPEEPLWTAGNGGNDVLFDAADEENAEAVDDDFGDFEDVQPTHHVRTTNSDQSSNAAAAAPSSAVKVGQSEATLIDLLSLEDTTQPYSQVNTSTHAASDLLSAKLQDTGAPSSSRKSVSDPSVPDEDDDWGDFQEVGSSQPEANTAIRPQSSDTKPAPKPSTATPKVPPATESTLEDEWAAFEDGEPEQVAQHTKPSAAPKQPPQSAEDDDWDDFEDGTPTTTNTSAPTKSQGPPYIPASESPSNSAFPPSATRPTNIPPPSTLLSLLPAIYTSLKSPTAPILLHLYQATARITAARPQRWRRDIVLAQSTRIAPAGKSGGMKLSSLNKGESAREEREASEALAAWNAGVPRWHGVLREGGVSVGAKGWRLQLPLGLRSVPVREAGLEASYVCPVCGMKRSERVVGVDETVEDVFGEFWVEGWGHRACGEVWYRFKGMLGQR